MVVTPFLAWVPWKREENPFCVNALLGVHLQARRCGGKRVVSQRRQRCKANQFCDKLCDKTTAKSYRKSSEAIWISCLSEPAFGDRGQRKREEFILIL